MRRYESEEYTSRHEIICRFSQKAQFKFNADVIGLYQPREFVTSTIIGATTMTQLKENIGSIDVVLNDDILLEIDAIQNLQPNPAP